MYMAIAKTNKSPITHILYDEHKSRMTKIKLYEGQSKMQQLVQTGAVNAVIAFDAIRVTGNETMSAMHREIFRVTNTRLWVGQVGVDPEDHLRLEHDRKRNAGEFLEQCHTDRKDLIEALDKRTRQEHDYM
jgi:hypothetical protein